MGSYNSLGLPDDNGQYTSMWGFLGGTKDPTNPYGTLNPEQIAVNKGLGSSLLGAATAPASDNQYTGQLTAPISAGEQDVVNNSARFNTVAGNTFNNLATYDPNQFNADFNSQIQDPTIDNFKRNIEPLLGEELPSFGTARANVVANAANDLQNNLLQQRFTANQTAKQTALSAITGAGNYNQQALQIASTPRVIQQAGLDAQYQNFLQANTQKLNSINQALNFLGISTGTYSQAPDPLATLTNLLKSGAQIGAAAAG